VRLDIIDSASWPGYAVNEDALGYRRYEDGIAAWVLDGATGMADRIYVPGAESDAAWMSMILSDLLAAHPPGGLAPRDYWRDILERTQAIYRDLVPEWPELPSYALPSACGVWLHQHGAVIDVASQGDCVAVIRQAGRIACLGVEEAKSGNDHINARVAEAWAKGAEAGTSMLAELHAELRAGRARLNQPGGYWMLGTEPRAAAAMHVLTLDLTGDTEILLVSDGIWRLVDHFAAYDAGSLLDRALSHGVAALLEALRGFEQADPEGRTTPRVKPYDDATGMVLRAVP
jgi:hypothetical protein